MLDEASQERIGLSIDKIKTHYSELKAIDGFGDRVAQAWEQNDFEPQTDPDAQLYDSFINDADKKLFSTVRSKSIDDLADWHPAFVDDRMTHLLLRYKARHFPSALSNDEKQRWEQYRAQRLSGSVGPMGLEGYARKLEKLYAEASEEDRFLIEELQLYAQSIAPYENESLLDSA